MNGGRAMKIFVVGDVGYDNYLIGKVRGISAEAPIPILDIQGPTVLPGMGLNVLGNLHQLGATESEIILPEGAHYPVKSRLMTEDGQQLARFDFEDWCTPLQRADLLPLLDADGVIVSDYGKGTLDHTINEILANVSVPLFVDTKKDPSPWLNSNATLFPNQEEYDKYRTKYEWFPRVVLKRGSEGLSYVEYGKDTSHRPAWAKRVQSVNGAGDTVIAAFAVAYLFFQGSIQHCLDVASAAAANVVEQDFLHRTTTPEAVGERITNEVPERVYNQVQTSNSGPGIGSGITEWRPSLPYQAGQHPIGPDGAMGSERDSVLAATLRLVHDSMEDDSWAV